MLFVSAPLLAEVDEFGPIIERPESRIWDRDDLFRNHPGEFSRLSQELKSLEEEEGMEVFIVVYSSLIGEKGASLSHRCQAAWLGDRSDGIVLVVSFNEKMGGNIGKSSALYNGHFIEEGILPRLDFVDLLEIAKDTFKTSQEEDSELEKLQVFFESFSMELKKRLSSEKMESGYWDNYHFMGWMALALLVCGFLIGGVSRLLGLVDNRSSKVYLFPEFVVFERLRAPYGGGKAGVIDFEKP